MAIYSYVCPSCSKEWDIMKSMSRMDDKENCECGELANRQVLNRSISIGIPHNQRADFPFTGARPPHA